MQIFSAEKNDGLDHLLQSKACITYASMLFPSPEVSKVQRKHDLTSIASLNDNDLYYVQSILVSSNWNKNDDIFDKKEIWIARNTPEDKPTNLEHNENIIIGHITSNWPITDEGQIIPDDIDINELPEKYHILTGSVIYRAYSSEELRNRTETLIAEIQNGNKYVSMECLFKGFDYGLINKATNEYKVLARNESTAYLTKFLRAYGGSGYHDNYKIGRVLRNITFSGKGFVDRPANPESIIFSTELFSEKNNTFAKSGVSKKQFNIITENETMSSNQQVAEETTKEMAENAAATEQANTELELASALKTKEEEMKKMKDEGDKSKADLEATVAELTAALEQAKQEAAAQEENLNSLRSELESLVAAAKKDTEAKDEEMKKVKCELDTVNEALAAYKAKEADMMKQEKKMKRQASLVSGGIDSEVAASIVEKFDSVDDDTFEAMTTLFAGKMPPWLDKNKKEDDKKSKSTDNTSEELLENVEAEADVNLGVGNDSEADATENTRAALVDFISSRLNKNHQ